ncbi:MAG: type IV pilus assembly protein PilM [Candidatus Binatia bacterium]
MASALSKILTLRVADLFRKEGQYVSLDIGSSSVKLLEVQGEGGQLEIVASGTIAIPASAVQNNLVQEPETVAAAIGELMKRTKATGKHAITAVPGPAVIIKKIQLPSQSATDLENAVLFEAGNFIPENLENVNLDYMITDVLEKENQYEVLLVAVKKDIINSYTSTVRMAGLEPVVVDVDYFALENMFDLNYSPGDNRVVALVNVGARYSCMNILRGDRSTFTGDVPVGGKEFNDALVRNLGVDAAQAETIKLGRSTEYPLDQIEPVLQPVKEFLTEEIHRALSFFWTASTDESISAIYLSGGSARVPGLKELLAERLEVPVDFANPFAKVAIGRNVDRSMLERDASSFAVAVGLGVRRPGDK